MMEAAIVAGVGPGTGAALAQAFAHEGYAVGLLLRHSESSGPWAADIHAKGGKALFVPTGVTSRQSVNDAIARIRGHLGPVPAIAYDASSYGRGGFAEAIVMGAVLIAQAAISDMLSADMVSLC